MLGEMRKEHEWLQQLIGAWTCTFEAPSEPGQPPERWESSEYVRALGNFWVLCKGQGELPGSGSSQTLMTLGYDPARQAFVGSFVASMMSHLWIYEGRLDAAGKELTLDTVGPTFSGDGRIARYQDIITIQSDTERTLTSRLLGEDGQWRQIMMAHYRRRELPPRAA